MRSPRNLAVGFSLGIVATATLAWALEVKIPPADHGGWGSRATGCGRHGSRPGSRPNRNGAGQRRLTLAGSRPAGHLSLQPPAYEASYAA
jgi:hypothetical protein